MKIKQRSIGQTKKDTDTKASCDCEDINALLQKYQAIPEELKALPQWVCWKLVPNPDPSKKPIKKPVNPKTGYDAKSNGSATWGSFDEAVGFYQKHKDTLSGIGFVFSKDDPFTGIDLDNCVDKSDDIAEWAMDIIKKFNSYTEYSQSKTGFHIIIKAKKPDGSGCKKGDIECYDKLRFFIFTGDILGGMDAIQERQDELEVFLTDTFSKKIKKEKPQDSLFAPIKSTVNTDIDVDTVFELAYASKQRKKITALLAGDNYGYPSESEADLGLCNILAFYCGKASDGKAGEIIDTIYRESSRYRPKWDKKHSSSGETYGQMTINKALAGTKKRYKSKHDLKLNKTADITSYMLKAGISIKDVINAAYGGQKGCSNLFITAHQGRFCFDRAAGIWYEFTGHFWDLDKYGEPIRACDIIQLFLKRAEAEIDAQIIQIATKIRQVVDDENAKKKLQTEEKTLTKQRKVITGAVQKLNSLTYTKQAVEFSAHGADSLGIAGEEWDQHPWKLAVKNGIINLKTGELIPGKPEDYIKSACPTEYDPTAKCPNFERFVLEILDNDVEVKNFLIQILGAGLIGQGTYKQHLLILSGKGRNGKDTLMGVIQNVLGLSLAAPIPAEMLLDGGANGRRSSQGPSADFMKLRGLRLAFCNEINQGRSFNSGVAKQLSGGGMMTAREPHGRRNVDWEQTQMVVVMTNHKPNAPIDDYAFWKRLKPIHFPLSFISEPQEKYERKADPDLSEKLKKESAGILALLIQGCLDYQKNGLIEPEAVKKAHSKYLKDVDITGIFFDECCVARSDITVTAKVLYAAYKEWAMENGNRAITGQAFGRYTKGKFIKDRNEAGIFYTGVGLL